MHQIVFKSPCDMENGTSSTLNEVIDNGTHIIMQILIGRNALTTFHSLVEHCHYWHCMVLENGTIAILFPNTKNFTS